MSEHFIPFHRPSIGEEEIAEVTETLKSGWLTTGPRAARFEREFSEHCRGASFHRRELRYGCFTPCAGRSQDWAR